MHCHLKPTVLLTDTEVWRVEGSSASLSENSKCKSLQLKIKSTHSICKCVCILCWLFKKYKICFNKIIIIIQNSQTKCQVTRKAHISLNIMQAETNLNYLLIIGWSQKWGKTISYHLVNLSGNNWLEAFGLKAFSIWKCLFFS